jgi:hypothetical protein
VINKQTGDASMTNETKQQIALAQLERHAASYDIKIHDRVTKLWKSGEILDYDMKCLPTTRFVMDTESRRLCVTPPAWEAHTSIGDFNPDILEPGGAWKLARSFVPLFESGSGLVVVRVDHPDCPVAWFDEAMWDSTIDGYKDGVWPLAPSLDVFLKSLVELETPDVDAIANEDLWGATEDVDAD